MAHAQGDLDKLQLEAVQRQQARVDDARGALRRAGATLADAEAALAGARAALSQLDALESELADAHAGRDRAADAEADELLRVSDILRRRQRLAHQRRDAANALAQLRASGGDRPSAETRRQVANIEAALSRAETEQSEAEGKVEAALTHARDLRLAAVAALERADTGLRLVVPSAVTASWPPGPPLPTAIADHRAALVDGVAEAESRLRQAEETCEAAGTYAEQQERDLDAARQARQLADRAEVIAELLDPQGATLLIDEAFTAADLDRVGPALEQLSTSGAARIVYLSEEPAVLAWAIGLPHAVGGISGLARWVS
jgi:hypothetical protein